MKFVTEAIGRHVELEAVTDGLLNKFTHSV